MRSVISWNKKWAFSKEADKAPETMPTRWIWVNLPHTWNAIDGQDGGSDFYRGTCWYAKSLRRSELPDGACVYLEFRGANSSADLYVNGRHMAHHDGGYSTWRANITEALQDENLIAVAVDNSPNDLVYPQHADFTFYGGLYRDVNLIVVPETHFDLDFHGGPGLKVTPAVTGADAEVETEVFLTGSPAGKTLTYTIFDREGGVLLQKTTDASETKATETIENVHLWNGRKDPYLYSVTVELKEGDTVLDTVSTRFGCRTFEIDPENGFFLNGKSYPLHGVSRHQDRWGVGNALLPEHHLEDMDLICEVGANTIRLAHYQHDQYFYDLCDERGMIIWAEIPYISRHVPQARANTVSQMTELVAQNYNHPSIVVWGLSNEVTITSGEPDPDLVENHRILNDLCHEMDPTRKTVIANVFDCQPDWGHVSIPDVIAYNHYFGWYLGDVSMYGPWLDDFHKKYPNVAVGLSEYGAEALNWHTSNPQSGDYTEEYQAYYHEECIKQLFARPYIWATHVWNMFDFGADNRAEGGENGQNHKGLVTIDRKYKKDSFYAYKAWLSDEPFVHICGKRYVDRVEDVTRVMVYSNQPEVELFANGKSLGKQTSDCHFFPFEVPNAGETALIAKAGDCTDQSLIRKVETFNLDYRMREQGVVLNWFDVTAPEGCFCLNDKLGELAEVEESRQVLLDFLRQFGRDKSKEPDLKALPSGMAFLRIMNMIGTADVGTKMTKEEMLAWNDKLNRVKKPVK